MFIVYFADIPTRVVKAEEVRYCDTCKKETKYRYEEVTFHARALVVNLFAYKKRYVRICSECNNGESMSKEEFEREIHKLLLPRSTPSPPPPKRYEFSKKKGVKYCSRCGEKIYPDIGYCTACAVRGDMPNTRQKSSRTKSRSAQQKKRSSKKRKR